MGSLKEKHVGLDEQQGSCHRRHTGDPGCQQRGRVLPGPDGLALRPRISQVAEMIFYLEGESKRCVFRDSARPNGKGRIEPLGERILHVSSGGQLRRLQPHLCGSTGWPSRLGPPPRVPTAAGNHPQPSSLISDHDVCSPEVTDPLTVCLLRSAGSGPPSPWGPWLSPAPARLSAPVSIPTRRV